MPKVPIYSYIYLFYLLQFWSVRFPSVVLSISMRHIPPHECIGFGYGPLCSWHFIQNVRNICREKRHAQGGCVCVVFVCVVIYFVRVSCIGNCVQADLSSKKRETPPRIRFSWRRRSIDKISYIHNRLQPGEDAIVAPIAQRSLVVKEYCLCSISLLGLDIAVSAGML